MVLVHGNMPLCVLTNKREREKDYKAAQMDRKGKRDTQGKRDDDNDDDFNTPVLTNESTKS